MGRRERHPTLESRKDLRHRAGDQFTYTGNNPRTRRGCDRHHPAASERGVLEAPTARSGYVVPGTLLWPGLPWQLFSKRI
jgi:hypothetical protein